MLVIGDLSGIQDFLFDVRESGGKQAASLRFRSFRLQVIAECLARKFLWSCGLDEQRLLFVAAGKFVIHAPDLNSADAISLANIETQRWLVENTHGRLRFAVVAEQSSGPIVDQYQRAIMALQRAKLKAWSLGNAASWAPGMLVTRTPWDADREGDRDEEQARQLMSAEVVTLAPGFDATSAVAGIVPTWSRVGDSLDYPAVIDLQRLSRHIPRDSGIPTTFVDLARRSRGAAMLGVLKADADSLGLTIRNRLIGATDLSPLRVLSKKLNQFFGEQLDELMRARGSRWATLYTVFSGGDDILLVGPWELALEFGGLIRQNFSLAFKDEQLTLSAGMALIKPKLPIRHAADQAEELLERAKTKPALGATTAKDQFAGLGGCWKWAEHGRVIDAAKLLATWTDTGEMERGWLYELLEIALLQRSLVHEKHAKTGMAASRFAYHTRKWPRTGAARQWINRLRKNFDTYPNTNDVITLHLPAIIRYAMLATESPNGEHQ